MAVSAFTVQQYDQLCAMMAKGVTALDLGNGEKVTFRSLDEMRRLKLMMEAELGLGQARQPRVHRPSFGKGL